jgi:hypothetical protein
MATEYARLPRNQTGRIVPDLTRKLKEWRLASDICQRRRRQDVNLASRPYRYRLLAGQFARQLGVAEIW